MHLTIRDRQHVGGNVSVTATRCLVGFGVLEGRKNLLPVR